MTRPLLVTGGTGYLGGELLRRAGDRPLAATHLHSRPGPGEAEWIRLDIRDAAAVRAAFERVRPAAVVHTAYRQDDHAVTTGGTAAVAEAAAAVGARLVCLSSDLVFDGANGAPYTEADPPAPLDEYGRAKAEAERLALDTAPGALVVRTSVIYGGPGPSRAERGALAAAEGRENTVFFEDELRSPILVSDLAGALLELVESDASGILHVAGADAVNRYELARLLVRAHGGSPDRIRRGTIAGSGLIRPANCALDSRRAGALLRTRLRGVHEWAAAVARPT